MARDASIVWVQLATRIPKSLHRDLRLHCVTVETSVMDFVVKAIEEKLAGSSGRPVKARGKKAERILSRGLIARFDPPDGRTVARWGLTLVGLLTSTVPAMHPVRRASRVPARASRPCVQTP